MRKAQQVASLLLLVILLMACAPQAAPAPAAAPAAQVPAAAPAAAVPLAPAKTAWQVEWEKTLLESKKEGRVVLYLTFGAVERAAMSLFERQYGLRMEWIMGKAAELSERLAAQRRAGLYQADVWFSGASNQVFVKSKTDPLEPAFILPELTEPELIKKTWYFGELSWVDKEHTMPIMNLDLADPLAINTNLVKPGEIAAYGNLLNPKWKGKISLQFPNSGKIWLARTLESGELDLKYMRELVKQEVYVTADSRLQVNWLAQGKHAIAIAYSSGAILDFIAAGATVAPLMVGQPAVGGQGVSLVNRAPHPNAAKLFINWLLSKDGQLALNKARGVQSQRLDVPTDYLESGRVIPPGRKVNVMWTEEFLAKQDYYTALGQELFVSSIGK